MTRIDSETQNTIVEIDGKEYPLAPRTIEIADKLIEIEESYRAKPAYRMWLEELRIMLGDAAYMELFHSGKAENIDRVQMIYYGVAKAFNRVADELKTDEFDESVRAVATALSPINEMLKHLKQIESNKSK